MRSVTAHLTLLLCCCTLLHSNAFQRFHGNLGSAQQQGHRGLCRNGLKQGCLPISHLSVCIHRGPAGSQWGQPKGGRTPPLKMQLDDGFTPSYLLQESSATAEIAEHRSKTVVVGNTQRRKKLLSAVASIIIAAYTLTACGSHQSAYAEFEPADKARPTDEIVLDMKDMKEACSNGWALNWRSTGKASMCLEPDGCLWRKLDISAREPGNKWYDAAYGESAQTYNTPFVNYLTRYLLNYDARWQGWWSFRQVCFSFFLS